LSNVVQDKLQNILGHSFSNGLLLAQALTHRTKISNDSQIASYDRLEFLGDAILDFVTSFDLFRRYRAASPGNLTNMRSALVSNNTLAALCVFYGLHKHLTYKSSGLDVHIHKYQEELQRRQRIEDEQLKLNRSKTSGGYWAEVEAPKVLSDMLEALIGAIYISDGFRTEGVEKFYNNVMKPFYDRYVDAEELFVQPTRRLTDKLNAHGCHQFEIVKHQHDASNDKDGKRFLSEGDALSFVFRLNVTRLMNLVVFHNIILARAWDSNAQAALRHCVLQALDALEGDPGFLNNCTCRSKNDLRRD